MSVQLKPSDNIKPVDPAWDAVRANAKAMVVDGRTSVVGSCNFDPRSLRINLEFFGVIRSQAFAAVLEQVCVYEKAHSLPIDMRQYDNTPWYRRWLQQLAWWFRHWL